jgi:radical SAM-linked protein
MRMKLARSFSLAACGQKEYEALVRSALDKSGLPFAQTRGKRPGPAAVFGPQLPPGYASDCEYFDVELAGPVSAADAIGRTAPHLPAGLALRWARRLPSSAPHLRAAVKSLTYRIRGDFAPGCAGAFREAGSWPYCRQRAKKKQEFDLTRSVRALRVEPGGAVIEIEVRPEGLPKPAEAIASVFGLEEEAARQLPGIRLAVRFIKGAFPGTLRMEQ